ncbi:MAG: hypothetical protein B6229_00320 [Spirochaetaceae bacterium 4572_7]|nr:MAG: hypothetical protein B6229_00320 [Spirochaetaceae bacterium 4572_7]
MFNVLTGLAMGIIVFAITIGVGVIVLEQFGGSVADCNTTYPTYNVTDSTCWNTTDTGYTPATDAYTNVVALSDELGTTGLAGWTAAIVALAVGLLFIGALMGKRKY